MFWLSFLTADDLTAAEYPGQYELDRKEAIDRGEAKVPLYVESFSDVPRVAEMVNALLEKIKEKKSKTIGIEVTELMAEENDTLPPIDVAVQAVQSGSADCTITIPERTIQNPFSGEDLNIPEKTFSSLREALLAVCMVDGRDLKSNKREEVRDWFVGHLWD
ncbi:MAG: hypothetical protein JW818_01660 [Pirellulales bacterium]|nr:hypothetical protein [Pirellulales bacterium]